MGELSLDSPGKKTTVLSPRASFSKPDRRAIMCIRTSMLRFLFLTREMGDKLPAQVSQQQQQQQQRPPVTPPCNSMHVCGRARTIRAHSRDAKTSTADSGSLFLRTKVQLPAHNSLPHPHTSGHPLQIVFADKLDFY